MLHEWQVIFRNDLRGFQRSTCVEAKDFIEAVTHGSEQLRDRGYNMNEFSVTEIRRIERMLTYDDMQELRQWVENPRRTYTLD